jgi:hypothetical protein
VQPGRQRAHHQQRYYQGQQPFQHNRLLHQDFPAADSPPETLTDYTGVNAAFD